MQTIDPLLFTSKPALADEVLLSTQNPVIDTALPIVEIGGPKGLEPTRYGDWERKGRCVDF